MPAPILVAHSVLNGASHAARSRFFRCVSHQLTVIGMNLFERRRAFKLLGGVAKDPLVRGAVVETFPIGVDYGDHVGRIFADQLEELLALNQLVPDSKNL